MYLNLWNCFLTVHPRLHSLLCLLPPGCSWLITVLLLAATKVFSVPLSLIHEGQEKNLLLQVTRLNPLVHFVCNMYVKILILIFYCDP